MNSAVEPGRILAGDEDELRHSMDRFREQAVDMVYAPTGNAPVDPYQTTLGERVRVTGPATYTRNSYSTLCFEPFDGEGWWFDRLDLETQLPVRVSVRNVWNTVRSIVLRSGNPHNYVRMVEHMVALRLGMGLDNVMIRMDSGDPPLFNRGSMPIVEQVEKAGIVAREDRPVTHWTVKEPVSVLGGNGGFLHIDPAEPGDCRLSVDCAIDFPNAIGRQRIRFGVDRESFRYGAQARTNCTWGMMVYARTLGQLFTDVRRMGYNRENICIAGRRRYVNEPRMLHAGKSLEAVWHRATLDLLAALSLIETGRLAGKIVSYKAGHALDVLLVTHFYLQDLLEPVL